MDIDEERYWQGLLGALADGSSPNIVNVSSDGGKFEEFIPGSCRLSAPLQSTPVCTDAYNATETVSLFVDVDLEDEKQFYFNYYKDYFESAHHDGTPPEPNRFQPANRNENESKDCFDSKDMDVWAENSKSQDDYDFLLERESETNRCCEVVEGCENTNDWRGFGTKRKAVDSNTLSRNCFPKENSNENSNLHVPPTSAGFIDFIPRFLHFENMVKFLPFVSRNVIKSGGIQSKNILTVAVDTALYATNRTCYQISAYFRSNVYISSFVGCLSESIIFLADRVNTASNLYVNQLTADDPERIHLERIKNSSEWTSLFLRYSMSSLTWKERQLIQETHSEPLSTDDTRLSKCFNEISDRDNIRQILVSQSSHSDAALYVLKMYFTAPAFEERQACNSCLKAFSVTLFRHHCRRCGKSYCDEHSKSRRCIFRFGIVEPVRVCAECCASIDEVHRRDCLIWKEYRVRAYLNNELIPYFNTDIDRSIDKAMRVADYSIIVAKNTLTLNYPTKIVLETVSILQRYGLAGFAGLLLRKDFMDSVETLKRISGMDTMFSSSIHELTACIYYKLAIERGIRGCNIDSEELVHSQKQSNDCGNNSSDSDSSKNTATSEEEEYSCEPAEDADLKEAIRLAPLAMKIAYERRAVDCQRLARLLGWDTICSNADESPSLQPEQPCYALLATAQHLLHQQPGLKREAVLAIRGTQTIQDVVTDIRAIPQDFNPSQADLLAALQGRRLPRRRRAQEGDCESDDEESDEESSAAIRQWEWLQPCGGAMDEGGAPLQQTHYACGGMSRAAMHLLREVGPSLVKLHQAGYSLVLVGHSLGGAVAAMLTHLLLLSEALTLVHPAPSLRCFTFGCPSCVDAAIADSLRKDQRVVSVVLHDDVISRITPKSIRLMMRELMFFRQQVFQHIKQDWNDVLARSLTLWSPRQRVAEINPNPSPNVASFSVGLSAHLSGDAGSESSAEGDESCGVGSSSFTVEMTIRPPALTLASGGEELGGEAALVQDLVLLDLWIPGKILHIYSHCGQYKACTVSRTFPDLRRIVLQSNMFDNHRGKNILDALLEVEAVRAAHAAAKGDHRASPRLVPFDQADTCQCCHNSFTWHSTFRGQAQEFRERYNCKYCGGLVCGPCSSNKRAMPALGFVFPRRICDGCLYKGDYSKFSFNI
mmetsp:Transcript_4943/g.6803  ORF Transcript_4943/g.6803 Transcript_4943/m.6803 type:complete len:1165 (+) Transcript_4943:24-3518(+)